MPDGKERRVALGRPDHHPDVQALRNQARGLIAKIKNGYDPVAAKQRDEKREITLREV
jgi:hypothetical protein